jgi:putative aldouronate transport system substrate-binding protein
MKKHGYIFKAIILSLVMTLLVGCTPKQTTEDATDDSNLNSEDGGKEEVTLNLLVAWQGLSFLKPSDEVNNAVANVIREKTGVTIKAEWINTSEVEKLNAIFSVGTDMPDMIMAPFWGGADANTVAIKKAAKDGLLLSYDDLLAQYPSSNVEAAYQSGISQSYLNSDIMDKNVGDGKKYVLPMHTPATVNDTTHWGYTVFARADILKELNVEPSSITSSEDLYELAKKIKEGNFTDVMGNPIIPASCWQNGWSYDCYLNSFRARSFSSFRMDDNDQLYWGVFSEDVDKEVLFMRKMLSEGLFDVEAFRHDDNTAKQKHIVGGVGLTSAHYPHIKANLGDTLYAEHPEMEYIPLGPILDANGTPNMPETRRLDGQTGSAVMLITKDCKNTEAAMMYLDYINSEEGKNLAYLGIEGVHYTMQDGKPKMTQEYFDKAEADPNYAINEGIGGIATFGVSRLPNTMFEEAKRPENEAVDETYEIVKQMYPLQAESGYPIGTFNNEYPKMEELQNFFDTNDYRMIMEQAYFAKSDEEALDLLNTYRNNLTKAGIDEYVAFMNEKYKSQPNILY